MAAEKNLRLLSESECQSLLGDLRSLGLPDTVRLYLVAGLPQVFERVSSEADDCFEDSWLYVPLSQVKSLRQNVIVEASLLSRSGISRHAVAADGTKLYPIVSRGEFAGFLSVPRGEPIKLDEDLINSLLERLEIHFGHRQTDIHSIVREFVQRLYRRDQAFHEFLKAALQLVTEQWERSMGAVYYDADGIYNMRMALGDIQYGDVLPSEVKQATAKEWVEAMRLSEHFVPADLLPETPTFLSAPPTFVFVHPAITSTRTEYILTVAVSGDIGRQAVDNIRAIAGLVSDLDESQFATSSDLLDLFGKLGELVHAAPIMDEIVLDVFRRLSRQLSISRLMLASATGPCSKVRQRRRQAPELVIESEALVPDAAVEAVKAGHSILFDDVIRQFGKSVLGKRYYLDNVVSELVFPLRWSDQEWSLLAIGTPLQAGYLEEHRRLLEFAAKYLEICLLFIRHGWCQRQVERDESKAATDDGAIMGRIGGRLADAILHAMLEQLSVVLGQGEIIEDELNTAVPGEERMQQLEGTRRINRAATAMAEYIEHLRWLQRHYDSSGEGESVELDKLCLEIPAVLAGWVRDLKARKRIDIKLSSECGDEVSANVSRRAVVATVLPLFVTLLDEAICSGEIILRCSDSTDMPSLSCAFAESLAGHLDMAALVERVYPSRQSTVGGDRAGRVVLKNAVLDYLVEDGTCRLNFSFPTAAVPRGQVPGAISGSKVVG